nr:reverse transcriptase domain-containing protein [Tanacetum cinerariifolium]
MSLESQDLNYAKENAHLKTTYKNLFDSIKVTQAQNNSIISSLEKQLYDTIYENAKLRAQLFDKAFEQKVISKGARGVDVLLMRKLSALCQSIQFVVKMTCQREQVANLSTNTSKPSRHFNSICYDDDDNDDDDEEITIPLRDIISQLPPSIVITTSPPIDDESLFDEDVSDDNFKIYSNPPFEFNDEYISSDVNPLFDEVLEDIECKDSYDPNLDEPTFLVTPLSDSNEDEYFALGDDIKLLLHHDPMMSVDSILEGFTDEPPLEENNDLFDLESKKIEWMKIFFSPSGDFDKFTLLVPGLWLLSFEGLGFDLLAELCHLLSSGISSLQQGELFSLAVGTSSGSENSSLARFDVSFSEAWDSVKDLLRACPHHGFSEIHQLDTFYNALNLKDQDSLNFAAGGYFLDKMPRECLAIIESKYKVRYSRNKLVVAQVSTNTSTSGISPDVAELKDMVKALFLDKKSQNQAPAIVKAVEESCVTYGGSHSYRSCPATDGNVYRNNIEEFVSQASSVNYNQGNTSYRPPMIMAECLALAGLGASINLMPWCVWKRISLPDLTPMCMTLELADCLISHPVGVVEDVYVKVGSFHFLIDFVVVDCDADPRVPLTLRKSFLKTERALIDVFKGELTLRIGKEAITFNLDQTSRYSSNYSDMMAKRIDVINMACEEYSQEVLGFSDVIASGNPTPYYDLIVSTTSLTLTPFGNSDFLLEEVDAFLAIEDDPTLLEVDQSYLDPKGDILLLEAFVNDDPSLPPTTQGNYLPEIHKELNICDDKLLVIIVKDLSVEEKTALITHVCIDYRKLNEANCKDHFPLPFMDQMLERLAENQYYCFLDGFSGYFQIPIDLKDQEKATFTAHMKHLLIVACLLGYSMHQARFKVLRQCQDKHFKPIHYASKTMIKAESNYTIMEKEILAVVYAFEKFQSYLIMNKSIVYTDHSALKYLFAKKDLIERLFRWVLLLQEFTFKVIDTKGA